MRVYFNTSALNRPLDDLSSERVRLEAEAVVGLLAAVESGRVEAEPMNTARLTNAEIRARGGMRSWRAWGLPELSASRCRPSGAPATMPLDATGCSAGSRWTSCWRGCGHPLRAPGAIGAGRERSPRRLAHPGQAGTVVMIHGGPVVQGALAGKRRAAEPRTFCEESKRSRPSEAP